MNVKRYLNTALLDMQKEEYKDKTVLIVSHSGVGRVTNAYFNGKPNNGDYTGFKVKNAEVVNFDWRETCEK